MSADLGWGSLQIVHGRNEIIVSFGGEGSFCYFWICFEVSISTVRYLKKKRYVEQINSNDNKASYNVFRKSCKAKNSDVR